MFVRKISLLTVVVAALLPALARGQEGFLNLEARFDDAPRVHRSQFVD